AEIAVLRAGDDPAAPAGMRADGIVTDPPGVALAVLTADCQPIPLADPEARVGGAVHAGWRGAPSGVLEPAGGSVTDLGASPPRAVIGPLIGQRAYEVGEDFMDEFLVEDPAHHRFFAGGPTGRPMFDLPSFGLMRLREAGAQAEWT